MGAPATAAFVAAFRELFDGQREVHAEGAGVCVREGVSDALVRDHLEGRRRLGIYCIAGIDRDRCRWACADVQLPDFELAAAIVRRLDGGYGLKAHVEKSKGRGWRVWLFFTAFVPCWKARAALRLAISDMKGRVLHPITIVPDHDALPAEPVDLRGRYVWLPLFGGDVVDGRTCFYRDEGGSPKRVDDWSPTAAATNRELALDALLDGYERNGAESAYARGEDERPPEPRPDELLPCAERMLKDGAQGEVVAERAKRLAVHLRRNGYHVDRTLAVLSPWNDRLCVPPLSREALGAAVRAGYEPKEGLGCDLPAITPVCARAECSVWRHCHLGGANGKAAGLADARGFKMLVEGVPDGEFHFGRGPMIYRVLNLDNSRGSLSCLLVVEKDGELMWRDRANLDSSLSRSKIERHVFERCKVADVAADLMNCGAGVARVLQEKVRDQRSREERARQGYALTEKQKEDAARWASEHPRVLYDMIEFTSRCGLIREKRNRILLYLLATSRKMKKPISGIGKGDAAAGKSHLAEQVFKLLPEEDLKEYTRITGGALYYRDEYALQYKLLFIREAPGSEGSEHSLRTFMTEDDLRLSTVQKDDGGRMETKDVVVRGPVAFYTTTTQVDINPENETRLIQVNADESEATTWAILHPIAYKAQNGGLEPDAEELLAWRNFQRELPKAVDVLVPFAGRFIKDFPVATLRARRDFARLIELVKACAYVHQKHRRKVPLHVDERGEPRHAIVASVADYAIVKRVVEESMMRSAYDVKAGQERILEVVASITETTLGEVRVGRPALPHTEVATDDAGSIAWIGTPAIRAMLGKSTRAVRDLIRALEDQGLLVVAPNRKPIRVRLGDKAQGGELKLPTIDPERLFEKAPQERALYYDPLAAPDFDEIYKLDEWGEST